MSASSPVLVVRDSGLGDLVTALPSLRALRRAYPGHRLVTTCPATLRPLAEWLEAADEYISEADAGAAIDPAAHPDVDRRILAEAAWRELHPRAVVLLRVPEDALARSLLAVGAPDFIGYAAPGAGTPPQCPAFDFDDHILQRWSRLLAAFGVHTDESDLYVERRRGLPEVEQGVTVLHPGAASPARHWPAERWGQVARVLAARGHRIAVTGSPAEAAIAARVLTGLPGPHLNLAGGTDVLTLAAFVAGARLVLSTDTGPAHLAFAFRRPSVTLFGPLPPQWWGPPPGSAGHACIWRGRHGSPYEPDPDPGLLEITVDDVLAAAGEVDRSGPSPPPGA